MTPRTSHGYIVLSLLLIVVVSAATFALSSFNNTTRPPAEVVKRQQILVELENAKMALLTYAGNTHVIHGDRGPGYLPAPGGSSPCATEEGLLPAQICDAQNNTLYQFSAPPETLLAPLKYEVAPTLVYPAGRDATDRTQPPPDFPDFADDVVAVLTYSDTETTLNDTVLPIRHEEMMTAIAPIIARHVGQLLTAYRLQNSSGGFPADAEELLEALDPAPATEPGEPPQGNSSNNNGKNPNPPGKGREKNRVPLDMPNFIPQWFFEENWPGRLTHYEQHTEAARFSIAGCNGIRFTIWAQDGSISREGHRCGN